MLNLSDSLLFLLIIVLQIGSPGPSTLLIINNSINYGVKTAIVALLGDLLAIMLLGVIAFFGLREAIQIYPNIVTIVRFFGGVYLCYLGVGYWKNSKRVINPEVKIHIRKMVELSWNSFLISITNPKAVVFFTSVFPIFIDDSNNTDKQFIVLLIVFILTKFLLLGTYALLAAKLKSSLFCGNGIMRFNQFSAVVFCVFGLIIIGSTVLWQYF